MEVAAFAVIVLIIVALQGWIFKRYAFKNLEYTCIFSLKEAYEGDDLFLIETLHNIKFLPVPWLKVDINSSKWLEFANTKSVVAQESRYVTSSFFLKGYQKVTRRWRLKCLKRGVYTIKSVTLVSGDLIGNNTISKPVEVGAEITVYPAMIDLQAVFMPIRQFQGDLVVKRWILDDPFVVSGAREYIPGDPMNRVHWSATARHGGLMVKKNDFTSQTGITVLLNIQSSHGEYYDATYRELIEYGIKAAATIFDTSLKEGIPVRLSSNGSTIDGGRQMVFTEEASGREHVAQLMDILARLGLRCIKDFEDYLESIVPMLENTDVILLSAYLTDKIVDHLRRIAGQNCSVKIMILDKFIEPGSLPGDMDVYVLTGAEIENA